MLLQQWLSCIAANLVLNGDYDIAVRGVDLAIAALSLAQLSSMRARAKLKGKDFGEDHRIAT